MSQYQCLHQTRKITMETERQEFTVIVKSENQWRPEAIESFLDDWDEDSVVKVRKE